MHSDHSDLLFEAIPESLKNMLLVMESAKVFEGPEGPLPLWEQTWERIAKFLPNLKDELFKEQNRSNEADDVTIVVPLNVESKNIAFQLQLSSKSSDEPSKQADANTKVIPVTFVQHNIENATRSSIILQPPSSQHVIKSPLFAHLGQVSYFHKFVS